MYLTYYNGEWAEGNTPLFGAMDHSVWLGSSVFDGARALRGRLPDLRPHLQRVIDSAEKLGLSCPLSVDQMEALVREGVAKFPADAELYIRPLVFASEGFLIPVPDKAGFALTLFDAPLPPFTGFSACLSELHRPQPTMAPTDAKASALYANTARALRRRQRGRVRLLEPVPGHPRWRRRHACAERYLFGGHHACAGDCAAGGGGRGC
jgi:branched-chain amino acid aminotransferase